MVKTTWRCKTAASNSRLSLSAHNRACLFSHEGQKERVRHEKGTA